MHRSQRSPRWRNRILPSCAPTRAGVGQGLRRSEREEARSWTRSPASIAESSAVGVGALWSGSTRPCLRWLTTLSMLSSVPCPARRRLSRGREGAGADPLAKGRASVASRRNRDHLDKARPGTADRRCRERPGLPPSNIAGQQAQHRRSAPGNCGKRGRGPCGRGRARSSVRVSSCGSARRNWTRSKAVLAERRQAPQ